MQAIPVNTKLKRVNAPAVGEDAQLRRADWLTTFKVNSYANSGEGKPPYVNYPHYRRLGFQPATDYKYREDI